MKPLHLAILIDCSLDCMTCTALREKHDVTLSLTRSAIKTLTDKAYLEMYDVVDGVQLFTSTELGIKRLSEMLTQLDKWQKEMEQCRD